MFPALVAVPGGLGLVSSTGDDARGGYGNVITFFRVTGGDVSTGIEIANPGPRENRLTVSHVHAAGSRITVYLLLEIRGTPENVLLCVRSADAGATWTKPVTMGVTKMHEDSSRVGGFEWSADHFGRFDSPSDGAMRFCRTRDGGKTWAFDDVSPPDDLGDGARRVALETVSGGDRDYVVYLGSKAESRRTGALYLAWTPDQGKSWAGGFAVTGEWPVSELSTFVQCVVTGGRFALVHLAGDEESFEHRMWQSPDRGYTWATVPLERCYQGFGVFGVLGVAPAGDRILFAKALCADPRKAPKNFVTVQEFSPREAASAEPTDEQRKQIAKLIAALTTTEGDAARLEARQALAPHGRHAKAMLAAAIEGAPDGVRRGLLADAFAVLFPGCVRLGTGK
jgi:hypothetical protein